MILFAAALAKGAEPAQVLRPIDLSRFYNSSLTEATENATNFPQGTQILGGTPFLIGGKMQITGLDVASHGEFLPPEITGIPIGQKFTRLHLIHGSSHGQKDGTPLANLVLHFKNGESRVIRLAFGVHMRNWIEESGSRKVDLGDPNSHLIWNAERRYTNQTQVRLYRTELDNPLPGEEVSTVDFVSLFSRATPIIFAITLQNGGEMTRLAPQPKRKMIQRASQFDDSVYRRNLAVRVTDSQSPLPNVTATLTIKDDARSFFFGQFHSDSLGRLAAAYPPQQAVSLTLRVTSPGFVPATANLSAQSGEPWPETLQIALKRGNPIGGLVQDSSTGKPIPEANVIPFEIKQTGPKQYTRYDLDAVKTGADGKWVTAAISESLSNVSFEVTHPDFHSAIFQALAPNQLLSSKTVMGLDPHLRIVGRVMNRDSELLTNATVILDYGNDSRSSRTVDRNGQFSFVVRDPTNTTAILIAVAPNFAPGSQIVALDAAAAKPVDMMLGPGTPFTMRMVDQNQEPVAGVKVSLFTWQGSRAYDWKTQTDANGQFTWEHAPSGSVTFRYEKPGHSTHTHSMSLPHTGEYTFTYSRMMTVAGKIIDAATKKPIDRFTVVRRYRYQNNNTKTWNRYGTYTGRKGSFSTSLGGISRAEWSVVIEAKGYEPFVSETFTGTYSNLFELKKGKPFTGQVVTVDGKPVSKAEVVLLDANTSAYMDAGGKFRRSSSYYEVATTDANGAFEMTPRPEADFIFAAHPKFGFAQAPLVEKEQTPKIVLQPWGHVRGVLRVGDKVEPYHNIALHSDYQQALPNNRNSHPFYLYYETKPDPDGSFSFDMVPPGARTAYLRYQFSSSRQTGPMPLSHNVPINVKPGETNDIVIGGTGRTIQGKIDVTFANGISTFAIDWLRDTHTMRFQAAPPMSIPPPIRFPPNATPEERQRLIAAQNAARQALYAERARLISSMDRTYVLVFDQDGSFHVPNVLPGTYMMRIAPTDPRQSNSLRQIGNLNTEVTVPEGTGPHDVGAFRLTVNP